MNIQIQPDNAALNPCVFRAADRMRIDGCANALANEGLSLALYCPYEALLDHYLNLLLSRLRQQAPEHRIEVYFPANTDSLLGRFNEVLASQTLSQAVKADKAINPAQIWVVHDAHALPESELQLLARLIQNFPGANIRAVLLMSGKPSAALSPLSAFGRKILRWDIEAPTAEQATAALELARQEGNFSAVQQLVQRIQRKQHPELDIPLPTPELPVAPLAAPKRAATAGPLKQQLSAYHRHGSAALRSCSALAASVLNTPTWLRHNSKLALGIAMAMFLSTLMMLWIQPEAFGLKPSKPSPTAAPLKSPALAEATPTPTTTITTMPTAGMATAEPTGTASQAATTPAPAATTLATAPAAAPATAPATPMAKAAPDSAIEAPEATEQAQTWVKGLDANSFLLQHGIANSYQKILAIQRQYPAIAQAKIVAAYRPGEKLAHFVIVSGPFSQTGQGYEASKREGLPKSWLRPTRGLQEQLKSPS